MTCLSFSRLAFVGKLPSFADFIEGHLPIGLSKAWYAWAEQAMETSAVQLEDRWLNAYLTSPVWRFFIACDVVDLYAYAGIVVPSVDQAGRYFPFAVFLPIAQGQRVQFVNDHFAWYQAIEARVLAQLDCQKLKVQSSMQSLDQALQQTISVWGSSKKERASDFAQPWVFSGYQEQHLDRSLLGLLMSRLSAESLWWTEGNELDCQPYAVFVTQGLPDPALFSRMIVGDWQCDATVMPLEGVG